MLHSTPLNSRHRELGAKMVDFGGWDMPLHYGSQIEEHHAVRRDAGMFDVSHMRAVDVSGDGARDFLRYVLANNVDKLSVPGKALYSCLLDETGGILDDLIVYFVTDQQFRLVVNASMAQQDIAWLRQQSAQAYPQVHISERADLALLAVQGPNAQVKVWQACPAYAEATTPLRPFFGVSVGNSFVARTGYTGEDGFEIMLPMADAHDLWNALLAVGVRPCGLGARDTLRLEAGMNLYGQDMDRNTTPLEVGLAWTVDLSSSRDFIGKPALQAQTPVWQMVGLVLQDKGVLRAHQAVRSAAGAGEITSGTFSPTLGRAIALARLPLGVPPGAIVEVQIRDKFHPALVVQYPFVRHGRSLIDSAISPKETST